MTTRTIAASVAVAMSLLCGTTQAAAAAPQHYSDLQVQTAVAHKLAEEDVRGVTVDVERGTITLSGVVRNLRTLQKALRVAENEGEGASVVNRITITRAPNDRVVAERAAIEIRRSTLYTIFDDVTVTVDRGVVTLSGRVVMPISIDEFEWLVSGVDGVQDVQCLLRPLPASTSDDHLRIVLAYRIYRDPVLSHYGLEEDPPIHIIVEHGHVALVGSVVSEIDRRTAEDIVRFTFGVLDVDNQLIVQVSAD